MSHFLLVQLFRLFFAHFQLIKISKNRGYCTIIQPFSRLILKVYFKVDNLDGFQTSMKGNLVKLSSQITWLDVYEITVSVLCIRFI